MSVTGGRAAGAACLALTMGEPAGIGGELTLMAWLRRDESVPPFFAIDDADRLMAIADRLGLAVPVHRIAAAAEAAVVFPRALPVLHRPLPCRIVPGRPDPAAAAAVIAAIQTAVDLAMRGAAAALVTNPIQKSTLYAAGFAFPGHTEFLASLPGAGGPPVMMLAGPTLRVVPVTIHVSLRRAISELSEAAIVATAAATAHALVTDFGIARPRLAVAGLNPHAGEDGALGDEDRTIIAPAIASLRAAGINAFGPVPADAMFMPRARAGYDAAICMYHDQALIPVKALDVDRTVNVTLGLSFVRTSPDHGTALDIAGSGRADPESLLAALRLAHELAARRAAAPPA